MEDYIDVLLQYISELRMETVSSEYLTRLAQEEAACEALEQTLTDEQHELFLRYDDARSATAGASEDAYARAAFLLAREIYR